MKISLYFQVAVELVGDWLLSKFSFVLAQHRQILEICRSCSTDSSLSLSFHHLEGSLDNSMSPFSLRAHFPGSR